MAVDETHEPAEPTPEPLPDEQDAEEAEEAEQGASPEPEPIEGDDDEPEPEPEPVAHGVTPEQWEGRFRKIERSFNTYQRAVEANLDEAGDDYCRCPMCLGDTPGFLNKGQAGRFPDEQADIIKQFLGLARPVDYPASSQHRTCPECQGLGKVTTGSRVPGKETIGCGACNERGYIGPAASAPLADTNGDAGLTGPTVYGDAPETGDKDEWDQPKILPDGRDNPNYGRGPKYWIKVEPWGDTRGLTARDAVPAGGR